MSHRALSAGLLALSMCGVVATASPALAVCDAYSGGCPSPAPSSAPIDGGSTDPGGAVDEGGSSTPDGANPTSGTVDNAATLPVTGGELLLLAALGLGTVAGGTALVLAGRRRAATPAA